MSKKTAYIERSLLILFILIILGLAYFFLATQNPLKVGVIGESEGLKDDTSSLLAYKWLEKNPSFEPVYLSFNNINEKQLHENDVLWFHKEDTLAFGEVALAPPTLKLLKSYIASGGKLLLSQEAALFISA